MQWQVVNMIGHLPRWAAVHTVMQPLTEQVMGRDVPVRSLARSLGNRFKS